MIPLAKIVTHFFHIKSAADDPEVGVVRDIITAARKRE
jgi:hypothetical protein